MITETEARELLAGAASTIAEPTGELALAPSQRARWIAPVVAAAAIAAAVTTGLVLIHHDRHDDQPGPVAPSPSVDPFAGRVPSVFAYDADSAQQMLESRGLRVRRTVVTNLCEAPGRALRTKPVVGSPIDPGDTVTLYVRGPITYFCSSPDLQAWPILDFANGRGPAPSFASKVGYYLNGKVSSQRSTLAAMAALTRQYDLSRGLNPPMSVRWQKAAPSAATTPPAVDSVPERYQGREALAISIAFPTPSIFNWCECAQVFYDAENNIDAIVAWIGADITDPPRANLDVPYRQVAARFVDFAKGWSQHPQFGEHVNVYSEGHKVASLSQERAADRSAYRPCANIKGLSQCGLSAVDLLKGTHSTPRISQGGGCFAGAPGRLRSGSPRIALITAPGVSPCESSWVIEVEFNDVGQITKVNDYPGLN